MTGLRQMHVQPCAECSPIIVNADVLAEMEAERLAGRRRCAQCDCLLDPASYAGLRHGRRYCSARCALAARRLRAIDRARTSAPPTPEQRAAIGTGMRDALAALAASLPEKAG